jgi:hypothetical protein
MNSSVKEELVSHAQSSDLVIKYIETKRNLLFELKQKIDDKIDLCSENPEHELSILYDLYRANANYVPISWDKENNKYLLEYTVFKSFKPCLQSISNS